jgi:hypothetical protein
MRQENFKKLEGAYFSKNNKMWTKVKLRLQTELGQVPGVASRPRRSRMKGFNHCAKIFSPRQRSRSSSPCAAVEEGKKTHQTGLQIENSGVTVCALRLF